MPLLQVREFPQDVYALLALAAEQEKRSITQQTIFMLEQQLKGSVSKDKLRRTQILEQLQTLHLSLPSQAPDSVELVRNERDRQIELFGNDTNDGRVR